MTSETPSRFKNVDDFSELPDVRPVDRTGHLPQFGRCLVLDGHDHHIMPLSLCGLQSQQRKSPVAGDHAISLSGPVQQP
jgi:hypothetical protein